MRVLRDMIINKISYDAQINNLLTKLLNNANVYLFGGAVRNYIDGEFENARDFDFIVDFNGKDNLESFFKCNSNYNIKTNSFGGYKFMFNNFSIDIWDIKNTWAFKEKIIQESVENISKSVFLNIDGVLYNLNKDEYVNGTDIEYKKIRHYGIMDIVLEQNPCVELNLLRALVLGQKYQMKYSKNLQLIFGEYIKRIDFFIELQKLQYQHYGKILIDSQHMNDVINNVFD